MRLLDAVAQSREALTVPGPDRAVQTLPGPNTIAAAVRTAPLRYVLDDTVTAFAATLAFADAERLWDCIDLVRMPAPRLWIEWNDRARIDAINAGGLGGPVMGRRRAGALITTDESGRRGTIEIAWMNESETPDLSPAIGEFCFDTPGFDVGSDDPTAWGATLPGAGATNDLLQFVRFRLRPEWRAYYQRFKLDTAAERRVLRHYLESVATDFLFCMGLAIALQARNAVALSPVSVDGLNRGRRKRQRPELLDFIEVSARLDRLAARGGTEADTRARARLHFVSGHLVRRASRVFWRRAHLRGDANRGSVMARTIQLRMGGRSATL